MKRLLVIVLALFLFSCHKKEQPITNAFTLTVIESNKPTISVDCGSGKLDTVKLKYSFWIYKGTQQFRVDNYNSDLSIYQGLNYSQTYELGDWSGYKIGFNGAGYVNGTMSSSGCDIKHYLKIQIHKNGNLLFERSSDYGIIDTFSL